MLNQRESLNAPTAVQPLVEAYDTLSRAPAPVFGVRSSDHSLPAQRSTSTPSRSCPTAMHADFDVHDTPVSTLNRGSFALRCVDHRLPFQRSNSGLTVRGPSLSKQPSPIPTDPTAVHVLAETHDTLESESSLGRADEPVVGAIWIDHRLPFHRSTIADMPPQQPPSTETSVPTAMHARADAHETPESSVPEYSPK
jgi:hypothetical protein